MVVPRQLITLKMQNLAQCAADPRENLCNLRILPIRGSAGGSARKWRARRDGGNPRLGSADRV